MDLGEEERIWKEIANSEARLAMMSKMIQQDLAFADLEEFGSELSSKMKTIKTKNRTLHRNITKPAMKAKLADEQMWRRDLGRVKAQLRKELIEKLQGEKTRRFKRVINHLNQIAKESKEKLNQKYNVKIQHLKEKYKHEEKIEVEDDMKEYSDLSVFNKEEFEKVEISEYEVQTVGEVELSENERKVLKLHNKFSILEVLKPESIDTEVEASLAKMRMEKEKDKMYKDFTVEERRLDEEMESRNRMIYDPTSKSFDNRKMRVTDLNQCTRVTLPKPLNPEEESRLEVRKRTMKDTFEKFRRENTNKKGEQKTNLSPEEKSGLLSLQKRIMNE